MIGAAHAFRRPPHWRARLVIERHRRTLRGRLEAELHRLRVDRDELRTLVQLSAPLPTLRVVR